jgi:ribose transport system substrate-binding protein
MNGKIIRIVGGVLLVLWIAGCYPTPPPTAAPAPTQAPAATQAPAPTQPPAATEAPAPTQAAAEPEAAAEEPVLLGFANMVEGYEFATMTRQGIEEEAAKLGWEVLLLNNNFDANLALSNADAMVTKGVDVAVEFQLYEDVMPAMMDKFNEAGIPVITIDIPAPGATFVGVNNYEAGKLAGAWLGQYALDNWGGEVDLVLLLDDPTVGELPKQRVDGIQDGILEKLPDLDQAKLLRQPGGGMREKGLDITRAVLTSHPDAHRILVSGIDDISLLGGYAAAQELGREKDTVFFGQGGEAEAIPVVRDPNSSYYGTVGYFFENYGKTIVPTAQKLVAGEEVPEFVYVDIALITKDNVDEIYPPQQ